MADISKITLPSGTTYNIKDAQAREDILGLQNAAAGAMHYIGVTTTPISDGSTTSTITIDSETKTMTSSDAGAVVIFGEMEYVWNGTKWQEFGSTGSLKALAFKDSASGTVKAAGTVSRPTFAGSSSNVTLTIADNTSGNYQPKGTVSTPSFIGAAMSSTGKFTPSGTVTVTTKSSSNKTAAVSPAESGAVTYTPAGTCTATVTDSSKSIDQLDSVGALPSLTTTVSGEVLTINFSQGSLPTKKSTSVKQVDSVDVSFSGTGVRLVTGNIPVPSAYKADFDGTEDDVNVSGTTTGSVSQPTFTGTKVSISGTTTAAGTVSQPTFTGTDVNVSVS